MIVYVYIKNLKPRFIAFEPCLCLTFGLRLPVAAQRHCVRFEGMKKSWFQHDAALNPWRNEIPTCMLRVLLSFFWRPPWQQRRTRCASFIPFLSLVLEKLQGIPIFFSFSFPIKIDLIVQRENQKWASFKIHWLEKQKVRKRKVHFHGKDNVGVQEPCFLGPSS